MDWAKYKMLAVDAAAHTLLLIDGENGEILSEMSYPDTCVPTALVLAPEANKAFLPAAGTNGSGSLFIANLTNFTLYRLPMEIPHPSQFAITPCGTKAYLVDPGGTLYQVNTTEMTLTMLGQPENAACVGILADDKFIYTAWEHKNGGSIATFDCNGQLISEYSMPGIPTNITINKERILIPFTATSFTGEGLAVFDKSLGDDLTPTVITIQCPMRTTGLKAYPCSVTVAPDDCTAYVINEDSGSITIIDLSTSSITGHIALGRSISNLYILPDSRFAIATSNMFADLTLIDLVNERVLSVAASNQEILNYLAIL
ncbi:YncE family protein [Dendrosporobacter sp. 1207_IL3150]|uniref:YncE family protein n=1 Tax=Dendrosporobacter sp. 1207_IL3150 TaxID=3084054 RepID=UPI002FDA1C6C